VDVDADEDAMGDWDGVGVRIGELMVECEFECVDACWRCCVMLVLILGLGDAGVELGGPGECDGDGFKVGKVKVGNISEVVAASEGTSNVVSAAVEKEVL
jgi:hypothetical protein